MQISESRLQRVASVRFGLASFVLAALALGVAGAAEAAQSCSDLVAPQDMEMVSSAAEVPGVYIARLNAGDAERVTDLFADDAVHRGPDGQIRSGRTAILAFYEGVLADGPRGLAVGKSVADGGPGGLRAGQRGGLQRRGPGHRGRPDRRQRRQPDSGLHGVLPPVRQLSRADPRESAPRGADSSARRSLFPGDPGEDGGTEEEALECLQVVLATGGDVNAVDENGETALHGAAYRLAPSVVRLLLDHGAETFTARNRTGWTPLHIAAGVFRQGTYKESPAIAELLRAAMQARGLPTTLAAPAP